MDRTDTPTLDPSIFVLPTKRLLLRPLRETDLMPFSVLNAEPRVMKWFSGPLSVKDTEQVMRRSREHFEKYGHGTWAVEVPGVSSFAGVVSLLHEERHQRLVPAAQVFIRFKPRFCHQGYGAESLEAVFSHGFEVLRLQEILAVVSLENSASSRMLSKVGMTWEPGDFVELPARTVPGPSAPATAQDPPREPTLPVESGVEPDPARPKGRLALYRICHTDWARRVEGLHPRGDGG